MVIVTPPLPNISADTLSLFHTTDDLLAGSQLLVFYGSSATTTASVSNSRIQAHIFSPTGIQSFPRLTISPTSPLYTAVECLPREEQGDEICRGLAFTLFKYFSELPQTVKDAWAQQLPTSATSMASAPSLFSEAHAAIIAARMLPVANGAEVLSDLRQAFTEQYLSWIDVDVVLPPGTVKELDRPRESIQFDIGEDALDALRYGEVSKIVRLFGEPAFLPTTRLRRAPSKPTAINRSTTFLRTQKESVRREMCELLDTEESYVSKLLDLAEGVATDFRTHAAARAASSTSPTEDNLRALFPPSLDKIAKINAGFLDSIRAILEETENEAIKDIETTTDDGQPYVNPKDAPFGDVTGALSLANCFLEWFPEFASQYPTYMQAHADFPRLMKSFTKDPSSSFSKRVYDMGEQYLTSMLIEPVQRLPRYNLYIDNIVKQLPFKHPAIKPLLKARDIISEICSRDSPGSQLSRVVEVLRTLVPSWPAQYRPAGRFISATDVVELPAPFCTQPLAADAKAGILLLFADCLVLLRKPAGCSRNARSLMADIDSTAQLQSETQHEQPGAALSFHHRVKLSASHLVEMGNGSRIQLINAPSRGSNTDQNETRTTEPSPPRIFLLAGAYEGKASRWIEEVTKAKVEGRFSELERESQKWEVRSSLGPELNLFSAIFEDSEDDAAKGRQDPASIRIIVNPNQATRVFEVGFNGIEVIAHLKVLDGDLFRLELTSFNEYNSRDNIKEHEFLPVLKKRLSNILQMRYNIRNGALVAILLLRNQQILKSLSIIAHNDSRSRESTPGKSSRPHSPVKMLTNLFSGASKEPITRKLTKTGSGLGEIPKIEPPALKPPSRDGEKDRDTPQNRQALGISFDAPSGELMGRMEATLFAYMIALHARKGNIVGKVLRTRVHADESMVNELYNTLLEDPDSHQTAAQMPVDVVFSAFENFLGVAWKDEMGTVLPLQTALALQAKSDTVSQGDFEDFFRLQYTALSPPNQRALRAIVRLLADLLEGTANDSDRGILTVSFAEMLFREGNPHEFVSLLDRFVEDVALLFGRPGSSGQSSLVQGSITSDTRFTVAKAGSVISNTSSLRKKFGFGGLSRENSKAESESKVGSVWRTLSKAGNKGQDHQTPSANKPTLNRSKSTETDSRTPPKRPASRERPALHGAFAFEESPGQGRSLTNVAAALSPIGEGQEARRPPRKKRRSSLSDLPALQATPPAWNAPVTPRRLDAVQVHLRQASASPKSPSVNRQRTMPSVSPNPSRQGSPGRSENSPIGSSLPRPRVKTNRQSVFGQVEDSTLPTYGPLKTRNNQTSGIPSLKGSLSDGVGALTERPTSGNSTKVPGSTEKSLLETPSSKRLRMQSPQKLRDRLAAENKTLLSAESTLHTELAKIGDELTGLGNNNGRKKSLSPLPAASPASIEALSARLKSLESIVSSTVSSLTQRNVNLGQEISDSLTVSENRVKNLDELYRQASAENDALYGQFNEELGRVTRNVRGGDGTEELKKRLKEALDEGAVLKKENWRLKRENAGLRAQFKE